MRKQVLHNLEVPAFLIKKYYCFKVLNDGNSCSNLAGLINAHSRPDRQVKVWTILPFLEESIQKYFTFFSEYKTAFLKGVLGKHISGGYTVAKV
ncbi:MAG: hypothetical protein J5I50_09110 [Chitinophagaceae bacterium]|nr:hypothetical protein [Chitinophagaceae bacterium]